jgi:hypothetical protein
MKLSLGLFWGCASALAQNKAPKLIDCHVHHNGKKAFLDQLIAKLDGLNGMALLITAPADIKDVSAAISNHPGRLVLREPRAVSGRPQPAGERWRSGRAIGESCSSRIRTSAGLRTHHTRSSPVVYIRSKRKTRLEEIEQCSSDKRTDLAPDGKRLAVLPMLEAAEPA